MFVRIYTTSSCPYCDLAKDFLRKNKVKFEEIDVTKNEKAAKEMMVKSGQLGVPVLEINHEVIVGFDKTAIKKALAKKNK